MKIILAENIKGLGQIGEVKEVSNGYAKNFLVPRKLAILATAENLKKAGELKKQKALVVQQEIEKMKEVVEKLKDYRLIIETRTDEKGNLYASVTPKKISEELKKRGIEVDSDFILIPGQQIKNTAVFPVLFKFYDVEMPFEVEVIGESGMRKSI